MRREPLTPMRTLFKATMDVDAANKALVDGTFQNTIQPLIDQLRPEAVYFTTDGGRRSCFVFFDLADTSLIPQISEPFFQLLRAEVDFRPVMNRDDLAKGLKTWGQQKKAA